MTKKKESKLEYLEAIPQEDINTFIEKYGCSESQILDMAEAMIDYCEAHGKSYKNYKAALRTWLRKEYKPSNINYKFD